MEFLSKDKNEMARTSSDASGVCVLVNRGYRALIIPLAALRGKHILLYARSCPPALSRNSLGKQPVSFLNTPEKCRGE